MMLTQKITNEGMGSYTIEVHEDGVDSNDRPYRATMNTFCGEENPTEEDIIAAFENEYIYRATSRFNEVTQLPPDQIWDTHEWL